MCGSFFCTSSLAVTPRGISHTKLTRVGPEEEGGEEVEVVEGVTPCG